MSPAATGEEETLALPVRDVIVFSILQIMLVDDSTLSDHSDGSVRLRAKVQCRIRAIAVVSRERRGRFARG
jgi:hypothetical protein